MSKTKDEEKAVDAFCKGFFSITDKCVKEDRQISFVHTIVTALEGHINDESRQDVVKKCLLHFLKNLQFDSDEELEMILDLWKKFSKTSRKLGAIAIFKNIEDSYNTFWQYYRLYIEALMEHGKKKEIPAVLEQCSKNCEMTMDELREKFGPKFESIFPSMDDDCTLQLMQSVKHQPHRKSVAPSKPEKKINVQRRRSSLAPPKLDMVLEKSLETSILGDPSYDPKRSALKDFQETLPPSQTTQVMSQPKKSDDFSIFCDEPSVHERKPGISPPTICSPAHKKPRKSVDETCSIEDISSVEKENVDDRKKSLDINSPTICGFGRPSNFDMLSSTPDGAKSKMSMRNPMTLEFDRGDSPLNLSNEAMVQTVLETKKVEKRKTPSPNLESALDRLAICGAAGSRDEMLETTVNQSLEFNGELNPWDENARLEMVKKAHLIVNQHDFTTEKSPRFDVNCKVVLGGENFFVTQLLGHGGFAKVFKAVNDEDKSFAIKLQKPACPYEVHMVASVSRIMPEKLKEFVMRIRDAFIFRDASAIVYDYGQYGTALDLANTYKKNKREIHGAAVTLIAIQLADVLRYIHTAEIIHADIKPDNLLMCCDLQDYDSDLSTIMARPLIRLIDFGRAIDMKFFKGKEFKGRSKTKGFDCCEMRDGRPWTYQTDFFGYVATLYLLIMNNYMELQKVGNKYKPTPAVKRRLVNRHVFVEIFEEFLNIPSCSELPDWERCIKFMVENLTEAHKVEPIPFRNGVLAMYDMIKHFKRP